MLLKRLYILVGLVICASMLLAACQPATATPPPAQPTTAPSEPTVEATIAAPAEKVVIEWWFNISNEEDMKAYQKGVDAFNNSQDRIELKIVPGQTDETFVTAINGNQAPDLFLTWDGSEPIGTWAENGLLATFDDLIQRDNFDMSLFHPAGVALGQYKGMTYGMPWQLDQIMFFWNKQQFRDAGLDPDKAPTTLEEVYALAPKLTQYDAAGNITRLGMLPIKPGSRKMAWMSLWGPSLYDATTNKITADDPKMIASMTELQKLWNLYGDPAKVDEFMATLGDALSPDDPFLKGQVSMMLDGDWRTGYEVRYTDNVYGVDFGVAPIPVPASMPERYGANYYYGMCLVTPYNAPHPEETWEAIKYLLSYDVDVMIIRDMWNLPVNIKALEEPTLRDNMPGWSVSADNLKNNEDKQWGLPVTAITSQLKQAIMANLDLVSHNKLTPQEAAKAINEVVQPELDAVSP
jgi:multiple sugar transport system substrate-binding protein